MKERIDGYLSNKTQHQDASSLVYCITLENGDQEWVLRRSGHGDLGLGRDFAGARQAINAWIRAQMAARGLNDRGDPR